MAGIIKPGGPRIRYARYPIDNNDVATQQFMEDHSQDFMSLDSPHMTGTPLANSPHIESNDDSIATLEYMTTLVASLFVEMDNPVVNIPSVVESDRSYNLSISSNINPRGVPLTYAINVLTGTTFNFSKTSNITKNEVIQFTTPKSSRDVDVRFEVQGDDGVVFGPKAVVVVTLKKFIP